MLFTSYSFIGFLIILLFAYYLVPRKWQKAVLLLFNIIFYYCSGPINLLYIAITGLSTWFCAYQMHRIKLCQKELFEKQRDVLNREDKKVIKVANQKRCKRYMIVCLVLNLGILFVFKYASTFFQTFSFLNISNLSFASLALPMGISFYTFQAFGYLFDVYRDTILAEKSFFNYFLFVSYFPQLIQGPISRWKDVSPSLLQGHHFDKTAVRYGLERILWGYFKKLVIADRLLIVVLEITSNPYDYQGFYAFWGMFLYTLQLYADFTGGIDIVMGISDVLGISLQENFIRPYFSKSLKEYWRRWHISMASWFRDYIFYPCSSSKLVQKLTRWSKSFWGDSVGRRIPVYFVSFVTWFCTGLWHGSTWNFIVWGLLNWFVLMLSQELEPCYKKFHQKVNTEGNKFYSVFQIARTFLLVCILNLFDCYANIADTIRSLFSIVTVYNWEVLFNGEILELGLMFSDYLIVFISFGIILVVSMLQRRLSVRVQLDTLPAALQFALWFILLVAILIFGAYGIGYDSSQFIYNRF